MADSRRIAAIDILRGLVIVLMALDHTRDFFQPAGAGPENLDSTSVAFFLTRWVTHFCAPVFIFLAGTSAAIIRDKKGVLGTARFLFTRGLWLMFLEATFITWSWYFKYESIHLGVMWGIGGAMVLMSALTWMPRVGMGVLGIGTTLALHAMPVSADSLLGFFFQPKFDLEFMGLPVYSVYVIVPWFAVMATGYGLSGALRDPKWHRWLAVGGVAAFAAFLCLRGLNGFGDPKPWVEHARGPVISALGFLNASKYPPSLDYQLMTLGPALAAIPLLAMWKGRLADAVETFGRVPMFFYLLHLPAIHAAGLLYSTIRFGTEKPPAEAALNLALIWGPWLLMLCLLWPICAWWDKKKRAERKWWMSYL